jgi:hypothetical protein
MPSFVFAAALSALPAADKPPPPAPPALSNEALDASRGKADTVSNDIRLNGVVSGNAATNVFTGANTIDAGSFANMSGIPLVVQNSGANVLIQNATVINLQLR